MTPTRPANNFFISSKFLGSLFLSASNPSSIDHVFLLLGSFAILDRFSDADFLISSVALFIFSELSVIPIFKPSTT